MFSLRRKIGTGATSRRRPARECKAAVESLDARVVPSITVSAPGSPIVESGLGATLNVALDTHGNAFAQFTHALTPGGPVVNTLVPLPVLPTPAGATVAYGLPTAVDPGDVAIVNYQAPGTLSDLLRFTDVVSPLTNSVQGEVVVYAAPTAATLAGLAPAFNPVSPLNGIAFSFGVFGLSVAEYTTAQTTAGPPPTTTGVPPEQATYSFLSEGNLLPTALPS